MRCVVWLCHMMRCKFMLLSVAMMTLGHWPPCSDTQFLRDQNVLVINAALENIMVEHAEGDGVRAVVSGFGRAEVVVSRYKPRCVGMHDASF